MQGTGRAVLHAAGSLSDALVAKQTAAGMRQVFAAKVRLKHYSRLHLACMAFWGLLTDSSMDLSVCSRLTVPRCPASI